MSTKSGYLRAAGKRYSFRRCIPSHLQALAGSSEVIRALGPITARDAQKQARTLASATDEWLARLARGEACELSALAPSGDASCVLALAQPKRKTTKLRSARPEKVDLPLVDVADRYPAASEAGWTARTLQQNRTTFRLFNSMLGAIGVREVQRAHVARFVEALRKLPASYARSPNSARASIAELMRCPGKRVDAATTLTTKTIARHLSALGGMFGWAEQQGLRDERNRSCPA